MPSVWPRRIADVLAREAWGQQEEVVDSSANELGLLGT
jgi:hypothetical protein